MKLHTCFFGCSIAIALFGYSASNAQSPLPVPEASPQASVTQTIGISEVTVTYHRPGAKGRQIWGALVPYQEVWRAGANENTTISFSHPVTVEGKPLAAGTYGLHMIPAETQWTLIFSKNSTSWGSYFYNESEDALRVTVSSHPGEQREWLQYEFNDLTDSSAVLSLCWEKLCVPMLLTFDTPSIVVANARDAYLRGMNGFTWQGYNQAAQYCVRKNINLPQALAWADQSIGTNENFSNLRTKAAILEKMGKEGDAAALRDKAMKIATEADLNTLGYVYLNAGKVKDAREIFEKNVKAHPDSWNVYDSLAETLEKSGDTKGAIKNYEKALKLVGDERNKKRITETLAKLNATKK